MGLIEGGGYRPTRKEAAFNAGSQGGAYAPGREGEGIPPHKELVTTTKRLLAQEKKRSTDNREAFDPYRCLGLALFDKMQEALDEGDSYNEGTKAHFFGHLYKAWVALAYEYNTHEESKDAWQYNITDMQKGRLSGGKTPVDAPIVLYDPRQIAALDAMAEATDIPRKRGQAEVPIPPALRSVVVTEVTAETAKSLVPS